MKKILSILLAVLMLGGIMGVGMTASAAPQDPLANFLKSKNLKNLSDTDLKILIGILEGLDLFGINYKDLLEAVRDDLPVAVKNALHKAGVMKYPIYERNVFFNFIFKWFLFGFIWM